MTGTLLRWFPLRWQREETWCISLLATVTFVTWVFVRAKTARVIALPDALVHRIRNLDAIAILGESFLSSSNSLTLAGVLELVLQRSLRDGGDANNPRWNEESCRHLLRLLQGSSPSESEVLLGDVCELLGTEITRRRAKVALCQQTTLRPRRILQRLDALSAVPFTALLTVSRQEPFRDRFPHLVGRNFGGFATVLMKPRIDRPPGDSRPVLHLWPALGSHARTEVEGSSSHSAATALQEDSQYLAFLRDVFLSKTAVFIAWREMPPTNHVGTALQQAWQVARARDPARSEPLAYAVAQGMSDKCRERCLKEFGVEVLAYRLSWSHTLERFLGALACACNVQVV